MASTTNNRKRVLSSGGVGTVYEVSSKRCCKVIEVRENAWLTGAAIREVMVLHASGVIGIFPQVYRAGTSRAMDMDPREDRIAIVMERATGGDLRAYFKVDAVERTRQISYIAQMLMMHLAKIHACGMVHCDLKPQNVLIMSKKRGVTSLKICDMNTLSYQGRQYFAVGRKLGTIGYESPERASGRARHTDPAGDVFSAGLCIASVLSGKDHFDWDPLDTTGDPANDPSDHMDKAIDAAMSAGGEFVGAQKTAQLVRRMICVRPEERPTAKKALLELNDIIGGGDMDLQEQAWDPRAHMGHRRRQITGPVYSELFRHCRKMARREHANVPIRETMPSVFLAVHMYEQSAVDVSLEVYSALACATLMDVDVPCDNAFRNNVMRYLDSVQFHPNTLTCDWVCQYESGIQEGRELAPFNQTYRLVEALLAKPALTYPDIVAQLQAA